MRIDEVLNEWDKDSPYDSTDLSGASLDTPRLYNKYLRMYTTSRLALKKMEQDMLELRKERSEYYGGTLDRETLAAKGLKPFQRTLLKDDVQTWVGADQAVGKQKLLLEYQKELIGLLSSILDMIKNRRWDIRNALESMKFMSGG